MKASQSGKKTIAFRVQAITTNNTGAHIGMRLHIEHFTIELQHRKHRNARFFLAIYLNTTLAI